MTQQIKVCGANSAHLSSTHAHIRYKIVGLERWLSETLTDINKNK